MLRYLRISIRLVDFSKHVTYVDDLGARGAPACLAHHGKVLAIEAQQLVQVLLPKVLVAPLRDEKLSPECLVRLVRVKHDGDLISSFGKIEEEPLLDVRGALVFAGHVVHVPSPIFFAGVNAVMPRILAVFPDQNRQMLSRFYLSVEVFFPDHLLVRGGQIQPERCSVFNEIGHDEYRQNFVEVGCRMELLVDNLVSVFREICLI